ncbi:hypothetical protein Hs30E_20490 [Lactococcus hodotermopsidis]|uniref:Uncharacterized protein n=1 Tax=Pseudolactococcus hodotermopsidis TaxID=2709157 RepID=A0A6A0BDL1_9LACT|nr:hypothetical protein [Lactococcus hodotermopsidis]GFH43502.1 hypothetical protein Hs30E_20490 [Lactococcus hodotermopsidis]
MNKFEVIFSVVVLVLAILAWFWLFSEKPEKSPTDNFTEEEKFYADLLLMKNDLDADAFETSKQMLAEVLGNRY